MSNEVKSTCTLVIDFDKQAIQCVNAEGGGVWRNSTPCISDWNAFLGATSAKQEDLSRGLFHYQNGATDDHFIVVFQPFGGLDWNIYYNKKTGQIERITEAR